MKDRLMNNKCSFKILYKIITEIEFLKFNNFKLQQKT